MLYDKNNDHHSVPSIPVYDQLSYDNFLNDHLVPNRPFLLSAAATAQWPARSNWTDGPSGGHQENAGPSKPQLNGLRRYAQHIVPVANTRKQEFSEFERTERSLGEVLDLWERADEAGDGLYVKDWHLLGEIEREGRGVGEVYNVPECFRDDWMNPPYTPERRTVLGGSHSDIDPCADFRFCYVGPAGTFTPLHRDVYSSYSWSANIVGRKSWWLFPPDRLDGVKDKHGDLVFDVRQLAGEGGGIQIIQQEGQVIFVPSGWYHQVENLDFCISINHNFISSCTIPRVYQALCESQRKVEQAIHDIKPMIISRVGKDALSEHDSLPLWEKEWCDEVQSLLERDAGWNWRGFWECIRHNILRPPADIAFSAPVHCRDGWVKAVMGLYKLRRDWHMLADARTVVEEIEQAVS